MREPGRCRTLSHRQLMSFRSLRRRRRRFPQRSASLKRAPASASLFPLLLLSAIQMGSTRYAGRTGALIGFAAFALLAAQAGAVLRC